MHSGNVADHPGLITFSDRELWLIICRRFRRHGERFRIGGTWHRKSLVPCPPLIRVERPSGKGVAKVVDLRKGGLSGFCQSQSE